jgi:hypothetical protein
VCARQNELLTPEIFFKALKRSDALFKASGRSDSKIVIYFWFFPENRAPASQVSVPAKHQNQNFKPAVYTAKRKIKKTCGLLIA